MLWYSLEVARQGASDEYPQHMFSSRNKKNIYLITTLIKTYMYVINEVYTLQRPRFIVQPGGRGFNPRRGRQHSFVEIDHEIFSTVILSLPLIQEGQLSVSGERMCTIRVNRLEDYLFVCVEVLRPSQPNGVMSSVVSLPNHTFTGQA